MVSMSRSISSRRVVLRVISLILIPSFILSDLAFAAPQVRDNTQTLAPHSVFQLLERSRNAQKLAAREERFEWGAVIAMSQGLAKRMGKLLKEGLKDRVSAESLKKNYIAQIETWLKLNKVPRYRREKLLEAAETEFDRIIRGTQSAEGESKKRRSASGADAREVTRRPIALMRIFRVLNAWKSDRVETYVLDAMDHLVATNTKPLIQEVAGRILFRRHLTSQRLLTILNCLKSDFPVWYRVLNYEAKAKVRAYLFRLHLAYEWAGSEFGWDKAWGPDELNAVHEKIKELEGLAEQGVRSESYKTEDVLSMRCSEEALIVRELYLTHKLPQDISYPDIVIAAIKNNADIDLARLIADEYLTSTSYKHTEKPDKGGFFLERTPVPVPENLRLSQKKVNEIVTRLEVFANDESNNWLHRFNAYMTLYNIFADEEVWGTVKGRDGRYRKARPFPTRVAPNPTRARRYYEAALGPDGMQAQAIGARLQQELRGELERILKLPAGEIEGMLNPRDVRRYKLKSGVPVGTRVTARSGVRIEIGSAVGGDHKKSQEERGGDVVNATIATRPGRFTRWEVAYKDDGVTVDHSVVTDGVKGMKKRGVDIQEHSLPIISEARVFQSSKPIIRLISKTDGFAGVLEVTSLKELFDYRRDMRFSLHKLAVAATIVPASLRGSNATLAEILKKFGGSVEVSIETLNLPALAGLGTSSAIGTNTVAALIKLTNLCRPGQEAMEDDEKMLLVARTLLIEQLNGTLGGWQDAMSIFGGLKFLTAGKENFLPRYIRLNPDSERAFEEQVMVIRGGLKASDVKTTIEGGIDVTQAAFTGKPATGNEAVIMARNRDRQIVLKMVRLIQEGRIDEIGPIAEEDGMYRMVLAPTAYSGYYERVKKALRTHFERGLPEGQRLYFNSCGSEFMKGTCVYLPAVRLPEGHSSGCRTFAEWFKRDAADIIKKVQQEMISEGIATVETTEPGKFSFSRIPPFVLDYKVADEALNISVETGSRSGPARASAPRRGSGPRPDGRTRASASGFTETAGRGIYEDLPCPVYTAWGQEETRILLNDLPRIWQRYLRKCAANGEGRLINNDTEWVGPIGEHWALTTDATRPSYQIIPLDILTDDDRKAFLLDENGGEEVRDSSGKVIGIKVPTFVLLQYGGRDTIMGSKVAELDKRRRKKEVADYIQIKWLTPSSRERIGALSVQIHKTDPNYEIRDSETAQGKEEVWIVTKVDKASGRNKLILGLHPDIVKRYEGRERKLLDELGDKLAEAWEKAKALNLMLVKKNLLPRLKATPDGVSVVRGLIADAGNDEAKVDQDVIHAYRAYMKLENELDRYWNKVEVDVGDTVIIPEGTVHALLEGVNVIEPQPPGNTLHLFDGTIFPSVNATADELMKGRKPCTRYEQWLKENPRRNASLITVNPQCKIRKNESPDDIVATSGPNSTIYELARFPGMVVHREVIKGRGTRLDSHTAKGYSIIVGESGTGFLENYRYLDAEGREKAGLLEIRSGLRRSSLVLASEVGPYTVESSCDRLSLIKVFPLHTSPAAIGRDRIQGDEREILSLKRVNIYGRAFANLLKTRVPKSSHTVIIGRDNRYSSEDISNAFADALTSAGIMVVDIGKTPLGMLAFLKAYLKGADAFIMITGRELSPEMNGINMYIGYRLLDDEQLAELRRLIEEADVPDMLPVEKRGKIYRVENDVRGRLLANGYRAYVVACASKGLANWHNDILALTQKDGFVRTIRKLAGDYKRASKNGHMPPRPAQGGQGPLEGLSVVVDAAHGVCGKLPFRGNMLHNILKELGADECHIVSEECQPARGPFSPNPAKRKTLQQLREEVVNRKADIGIFFNSDGALLAVVDEKGDIISTDTLFAWLMPFVLEGCPQGTVVVTDNKFTPEVTRQADRLRYKHIRCPTGYRLIAATMSKHSAPFGAGNYGNFHHKAIAYDGSEESGYHADAMLWAVMVCRFLNDWRRRDPENPEKTLSQSITEKVPFRLWSTPELRIAVPSVTGIPQAHAALVSELEKAGYPPKIAMTTPEISYGHTYQKIWLEAKDGHSGFIVRPSGNEPEISIRLWAEDRGTFAANLRNLFRILRRLNQQKILTLPDRVTDDDGNRTLTYYLEEDDIDRFIDAETNHGNAEPGLPPPATQVFPEGEKGAEAVGRATGVYIGEKTMRLVGLAPPPGELYFGDVPAKLRELNPRLVSCHLGNVEWKDYSLEEALKELESERRSESYPPNEARVEVIFQKELGRAIIHFPKEQDRRASASGIIESFMESPDVVIDPSLTTMKELVAKKDISEFIRRSRWAKTAGAGSLHLDIFDEEYVGTDNMDVFTPELAGDIKKTVEGPLVAHLMVGQRKITSQRVVERFIEKGADCVTLHRGAFQDDTVLIRYLGYIRSQGRAAGLAFNPNDRVDDFAKFAEFCDYVLVMTVEPGAGGRGFEMKGLRNLAKLQKMNTGKLIAVDGAITPETVGLVTLFGGKWLCSGSHVFGGYDILKDQGEIKKAVDGLVEGARGEKAFQTHLLEGVTYEDATTFWLDILKPKKVWCDVSVPDMRYKLKFGGTAGLDFQEAASTFMKSTSLPSHLVDIEFAPGETFKVRSAGTIDAAGRRIIGYFQKRGKISRADVKLLASFAASPTARLAQKASQKIFEVVNWFHDAHAYRERQAIYKMLSQVFDIYRRAPAGAVLNQHLGDFDVKSEEDMLRRIERVRLPRPIDDERKKAVKKVFIMSRGPIGGDMNLTSIIMQKALRALPNAEIILLGSPDQLEQLFGGNERIKVAKEDLRYDKKKPLKGQIADTLRVSEALKASGFDEKDSIFMDTGSHLLRHGLIPMVPDGNYYYLEMNAPQGMSLGEKIDGQSDEIFFGSRQARPTHGTLYLKDEEAKARRADEFFKAYRLDGKKVVYLQFGVGGDESKALSVDFEAKLIKGLIREHGFTVILDRGWRAEALRTLKIKGILEGSGITAAEFDRDDKDLDDPKKIGFEEEPQMIIHGGSLSARAAVLKRCGLFIGYDSMAQHMAATQRVPVVSIFAGFAFPRFPELWRPYTSSRVEQVIVDEARRRDTEGILADVLKRAGFAFTPSRASASGSASGAALDLMGFEEEVHEWFRPELIKDGVVIGVPKEIKPNEKRVGLTPNGVWLLKMMGVREILVEMGAGEGAGYTDKAYLDADAQIVKAETAWGANLIVKVKEPLPEEYAYIRKDQTIFTYFHLASGENKNLTEELIRRKVLAAVAYETIEVDGRFPLLAPMSEIAGRLAAYWATFYVSRLGESMAKAATIRQIRKGIRDIPQDALRSALDAIASTYPTILAFAIKGRQKAVVLGGGVVGMNAALELSKQNIDVTIVEERDAKAEEIRKKCGFKVVHPEKDRAAFVGALEASNIIVSEIYRHGARASKMINKALLEEVSARKRKVIIDVAIDQGGSVCGSHTTYYENPVFVDQFGNLRFCVANMPAAVPRQASIALENAKLKYLLALSCGLELSADVYPELRGGVNILRGDLLSEAIARAHELPYSSAAIRASASGKVSKLQSSEPIPLWLDTTGPGAKIVLGEDVLSEPRWERPIRDAGRSVADDKAVAAEGDRRIYHGYRNVRLKGHNQLVNDLRLRYDITVLEPGFIGDEFIMTKGHIHKGGHYPEIYEVLEGDAIFLQQGTNPQTKKFEVIAIRAKTGDKVFLLPNYAHRAVNIGRGPLVMANWVSDELGGKIEVKNGKAKVDFSGIEKKRGFAYRVQRSAAGGIEFVYNPNYGETKCELIYATPNKLPRIGTISFHSDESMYRKMTRIDSSQQGQVSTFLNGEISRWVPAAIDSISREAFSVTNAAAFLGETERRGSASGMDVVPPGRIKLLAVDDKNSMVSEMASRIAAKVKAANQADTRVVLGLATGGTMEAVYDLIVAITERENLDWSKVVTFNIDEYRGLSKDHGQSYRRYMDSRLFDRLVRFGLKKENTHIFDGMARDPKKELEGLFTMVDRAGGIDLLIDGMGRDGHCAFLEPAVMISDKTVAALKAGLAAEGVAHRIRDFNDFVVTAEGLEEQKEAIKQVLINKARWVYALPLDEDLVARLQELWSVGGKEALRDDVISQLRLLARRLCQEQTLHFYVEGLDSEKRQQILMHIQKDLLCTGLYADRIELHSRTSFFGSRGKITDLALPTIIDNSRYFRNFDTFPMQAYTMAGIILEAREILVAANGEAKADAIAGAMARPISPETTSSMMQTHLNTTFIVSEDALTEVPPDVREAALRNYQTAGRASASGNEEPSERSKLVFNEKHAAYKMAYLSLRLSKATGDKKAFKGRLELAWAWEELWLESQATKVAEYSDLKAGDIVCNIRSKTVFKKDADKLSEDAEKELLAGIAKGHVFVLKPLELSDEIREERDRLEGLLNSRDPQSRQEALRALKMLEDDGNLPKPNQLADVFQHCHTKFSYSPYYPTYVAWRAHRLGLTAVGIVDHDTTAGFREFRTAGELLGIKCTCGYEQRAYPVGTEFMGMAVNSPGNAGEMYIAIHAVADDINEQLDTRVRPAKIERFKRTIEHLNSLRLGLRLGLDLDYERDVRPRTERNIPSERHLADAIADRLRQLSGQDNWDALIRYVEELISFSGPEREDGGRTMVRLTDKEREALKNPYDFGELLREKVIKAERRLFAPSLEENLPLEEVVKFAHSKGALAYYCYLGDNLCEAERPENLERFLKYLKEMGIDGIAYMPNRNTPEELERVIPLFKQYDFRVANGMDVNKPGMPFTFFEYSCWEEAVMETEAIIAQEEKALAALRSSASGDGQPYSAAVKAIEEASLGIGTHMLVNPRISEEMSNNIAIVINSNLVNLPLRGAKDEAVKDELAQKCRVWQQRVEKMFKDAKTVDPKDIVNAVNKLRTADPNMRVIVLDDAASAKEVDTGLIRGVGGKDYCFVRTNTQALLEEGIAPFLDLDAMAMMGVGILQKRANLFDLAYKAFTGRETPAELLESVANGTLDWFIQTLPRMIRLTGRLSYEKQIQALIAASA